MLSFIENTITQFFISFPPVGWWVIAILLFLWFALHLYEGWVLSGFRLFSTYKSIGHAKRLMKTGILVVAAVMSLIAILFPERIAKSEHTQGFVQVGK